MPLSTGNVFFMLEVVKVPHLVADCCLGSFKWTKERCRCGPIQCCFKEQFLASGSKEILGLCAQNDTECSRGVQHR